MNKAHYIMPGVIQVTGGDGPIETKEEFDQWYTAFMREIGVSKSERTEVSRVG